MNFFERKFPKALQCCLFLQHEIPGAGGQWQFEKPAFAVPAGQRHHGLAVVANGTGENGKIVVRRLLQNFIQQLFFMIKNADGAVRQEGFETQCKTELKNGSKEAAPPAGAVVEF